MVRCVIRLFDYMATHKLFCLLSFVGITLASILSLVQLNYKEDISDFLPVGGLEKEALSVYQDISKADRIFALFQYHSDSLEVNPDLIIEAISSYKDILSCTDTMQWVKDLTVQVELEKFSALVQTVYEKIPYFLTEDDYVRMDSLLDSKDYIREQIQSDMEMLMFPSSSLTTNNISCDPLNLFSEVMRDLQSLNQSTSFDTYDGYIFTPGMKQALVMMRSPFGNSETQQNTYLMAYLSLVADSVCTLYPNISIHYIGGPVIAVDNARQIKNDSIWSVSFAVMFLLLLLGYSLKRFSYLLLIAVSISWGWIFAMGMLSFVNDNISLIVIGISSIILGIAINYPLHLIAHLSATPNVRSALREVASPLIIGNITTVGAFLALVPLDAVALRDLGLFSAFLLIGTILFVILYLPHVINYQYKTTICSGKKEYLPFLWLSQFTLESKKWILSTILILTLLLGFFSTSTRFDTNIAHINYMKDEQRHNLEYFQQLTTADSSYLQPVYVVSRGATLNETLTFHEEIQDSLKAFLNQNEGEMLYTCRRFFTSEEEQFKRLNRWSNFVSSHYHLLVDELLKVSDKEGFAKDAFAPYLSIINAPFTDLLPVISNPLYKILSNYMSVDSVISSYQIIDILKVTPNRKLEIENKVKSFNSMFKDKHSDSSFEPIYYSFDTQSMNSALTKHLSENFNYIGWACSIIVFLFLWFSFGKIELAILSFLPMAVSWVWILGLMGLLDIHFNIVNIILATFIFGQGDDYTIFITEGCCYEYAYRKRLLASYKSSIIISALIMFIGIGTLILAKHPALYSLAQITIIGMFSVVLMSFTLPPVVFNWLVKQNGNYRQRPLTLTALARTWCCGIWWLAQLGIGYFLGLVLVLFGKASPLRRTFFNKFVSLTHRTDQHLIPGVRFYLRNPHNEDFQKPTIIVYNHQSMLDPMFLMALSHKILIVTNKHSSHTPIIRNMFRWLFFYTINQNDFQAWQNNSLQHDIEAFRTYIKQGYSIALFSEEVQNLSSSILKYHNSAFYLAHELDIDILPVIIHGMNNIMPLHSFMIHPGRLTVCIEKRITRLNPSWGKTYQETAKLVHRYFIEKYGLICRELEKSSYFKKLVLERYMYKGADVYRTTYLNLKRYDNYSKWVDFLPDNISAVYVINSGLGEFTLLLALVNPNISIIGIESDDEKRILAYHSAESLVLNLSYIENKDTFEDVIDDSTIIIYDTHNLK